MTTEEDLYKGNKASDYQPPTQNPQSASTNLQQGSSGLQPTEGQDDVSQQRLPSVEGLKVVILQNGSGRTNEQLTPMQTATQTWVGPFWGCVVLGIVAIMIWVVRVLAKEEAPKLAEALEEAIHEPLIAEEVVATTQVVAPKKKKTTKKSPVKKPTKKKSKKK